MCELTFAKAYRELTYISILSGHSNSLISLYSLGILLSLYPSIPFLMIQSEYIMTARSQILYMVRYFPPKYEYTTKQVFFSNKTRILIWWRCKIITPEYYILPNNATLADRKGVRSSRTSLTINNQQHQLPLPAKLWQ